MTKSIYLYVPNIIGYVRVLLNFVAFAICFIDKKIFSILYFISFLLDGVDGMVARKMKQVSTFGAVLDMVTDRVSTACLLVILTHFYRPAVLFLFLLGLDISSHWLQMYSTFLAGKASHKDVKDSPNWLLKAYYGSRLFLGFCCLGSEAIYIILFLVAGNEPISVIDAFVDIVKNGFPLSLLAILSLFGWAIKQLVNVIQLKHSADICVLYDLNKED